MSTDLPTNFGGILNPSPSNERNFLDHYFSSIYNKLEADALLFNRNIPHAGLLGAENENALAGVLREFLPAKYGIEVNALVIDRFGKSTMLAATFVLIGKTQFLGAVDDAN